MGIFRHENMEMDMSTSSKTRLYKDDRLIFMGDGYKAITIMINNSKNQEPVREKFHAQLTMREKPKFGKGDDIEALRKQALDDHAKNLSTKKKKSR
jgi:hypothetical protein|tara:strand:+ start:155 stop:442 length:288 start_codon:yes stop_codon:yes gene_type:complete